MSKLLDILQKVNDSANEMRKKRLYSEPKIYTGGVDVSQWNRLGKEQQKTALNKDWFVYYSYRDPATGKLKRQPDLKAGANYYKTKAERLEILKPIRDDLSDLLSIGFNPYDPERFTGKAKETLSVSEAFDKALAIKKAVLSPTSYRNFAGRINRFLLWLTEHGFEHRFITSVGFDQVNDYLNMILQQSSAANRNNTRLDLSALFGTMAKERMIRENFVSQTDTLTAKPERNKSYTTTQEADIFAYMKVNDPDLLLFVKFVSYNFLRPVEVCRLQIKDVDLVDRRLYLRTKNEAVKEKLIPQILINDLPDLSIYDPNDYLFTPLGVGKSDTSENDRRGYFGKRFKKVKDHFKLGSEYGLYSFRHTFISKLYNVLIKDMNKEQTESYLMEVTGHKTRDALRRYLRNIDAYRPEDYSKHIS